MPSRCLALCSWSLQPESPVDLVNKIKQCGFHAVQLALVPLIEDGEWYDAIDDLAEAGVMRVSGMLETVGEDYSSLASIAQTGGVRPDETWPLTKNRAIKVAELAGEIAMQLVTFHAGFLPEKQCSERTKMLSRIDELGDIFGNHSVQIALETGQERARALVEVLEELSHPMIGVNFDPANMILYGKGDPVEAIEQLAPWVKQVHIKDAVASGAKGEWGTEVPVGEGEVDWEKFMKCIPEQVVDLVIERESGTSRVQEIQQAKRFIKGLVEC